MNVIDSNILERDAGGKPLHTFPHPALGQGFFRRLSDSARSAPDSASGVLPDLATP
ncbi:hypothetical protein J2S34_001677 [Nitrobacter winogradskyi]|uniref:Uncharacterized protein n=1 Tax=Nitrobacter winogradskyi TaxID=913 RepID=A0ACC6AHJ1_NITWI|nr:hypothetical protein [Nitrobacter winogradskyi]